MKALLAEVVAGDKFIGLLNWFVNGTLGADVVLPANCLGSDETGEGVPVVDLCSAGPEDWRGFGNGGSGPDGGGCDGSECM